MELSNDEIRKIIEDEVIVDCYGEEEVNLGWAVFMKDNIFYPFEAEYKVKFKTGQHKWTRVLAISNESTESSFHGGDYYVEIEYGEIIISVKLDELRKIKADEETMKAIQVWQSRNRY